MLLWLLIPPCLAASQNQAINISVARSFADTGVLQALTRKFNEKYPGITVNIQPVGSLQALDHARQQLADLVISHYPMEEKRLVSQGFATRRTQLIQSKFAVFGPASDEYRLKQQTRITKVLKILAEKEAPFISPSPHGGTHAKIEELWILAGIHPDWIGHEYTQISSLGALMQAEQAGGYTIADLGTYLSNKDKFADSFIPLYQNDIALQNIYSVLVINPNNKAAETFYRYMVSAEGQSNIQDIAQRIYHAAFIAPISYLDPEFIAEQKARELEQYNRSLMASISLLGIIVLLMLFALFQSRRLYVVTLKEYQVEKRYRAFVETTPDWIWEVDNNAVYTYASPKVEQLLGYKPEEIIGKTPFDLMPEEEAERVAKVFADIASDQRPFYDLENTNLHKNGELVVLATSGLPVFSENGTFMGYRGIDRNITDRKTAEKEQQRLQRELQQAHKMESLGQLTAGIAHDFNNLLGVILGFTELSQNLPAEKQKARLDTYLDHIKQAGERARNLVSQMLLFSSSGRVEKEVLHIQDILHEDFNMLRAMLPSSIYLEQDIDETTPAVLINKTRVEQVLMNLAVNARDAMNGSGKLTISLKYKQDLDTECSISHRPIKGDWVILSVSDTGSGMSEELVKKIFDPFFTTKEQGKGTGMGLSVVYGIMVDYSGAIIVDSEPDQGTTFHLLFPPAEAARDSNQVA